LSPSPCQGEGEEFGRGTKSLLNTLLRGAKPLLDSPFEYVDVLVVNQTPLSWHFIVERVTTVARQCDVGYFFKFRITYLCIISLRKSQFSFEAFREPTILVSRSKLKLSLDFSTAFLKS